MGEGCEEETIHAIVPRNGVRKEPLRSMSLGLVIVVLFFVFLTKFVEFLRPVSKGFFFLLYE